MAVIKGEDVQILDIGKIISTDIAKDGKTIPKVAVMSQFKVPNLSTVEDNEIRQGSYLYWTRWAWSPNNNAIAYVGKDNEIWTMSAKGTNQKQVTFERTTLVHQARREQERKQSLAREQLESELKK